jgi:hypothetical protein
MDLMSVNETAPKKTNVDELYYLGVSALLTKSVVNHTTDDWARYFDGLRNLVRRVVAETTENGLSDEDRAALIARLMDHLAELEKNWPSLAAKQ